MFETTELAALQPSAFNSHAQNRRMKQSEQASVKLQDLSRI